MHFHSGRRPTRARALGVGLIALIIAALADAAPTTTCPPLRHFQCYGPRTGPFRTFPDVTVRDVYGTVTGTVERPEQLCAPADKEGEDPPAPGDPEHLVGYRLRLPFAARRGVRVVNQFGTTAVDVIAPERLMVPSTKGVSLPAPRSGTTCVDHFLCYRVRPARGEPPFARRTVAVEDQFGAHSQTIRRPVSLCLPADKNGEAPDAPAHADALLCYETAPTPFGRLTVNVANQLERRNLDLNRRQDLCVPSRFVGPTSRLVVSGLADAVGVVQDFTVTAQDAFGNTTPDYRGTVHFQGSGPPAAYPIDEQLFPGFDRFNGFTLPGDHTFTAADAGVHTFAGGATIIFAGAQTVTATDTQDGGITGSQTVTITPGPTAGYDVLAPVLSRLHRLRVVSAQILKQTLTVAAFDQWGNVATSDDRTLDMTYARGGGTDDDLPPTLTLVDGTASYDVTWPTLPSGDVAVIIMGRTTGPSPKTFTRAVEIDIEPPAANLQAIAIPPPVPGGLPTFNLSVPDQSLVISGPLDVLYVVPPTVKTDPITIGVSGVALSGDVITTSLTISAPVTQGTGLIVDAGFVPSSLISGQFAWADNATGAPIIEVGSQITSRITATGGVPDPVFANVQVIAPGYATLVAQGDGRNQLITAFSVAPPQCSGGQTWSIGNAQCD